MPSPFRSVDSFKHWIREERFRNGDLLKNLSSFILYADVSLIGREVQLQELIHPGSG